MVKGDRLRALRKAKGLTQGQLGDMIGVKKSVICLYERELRNPTIESIVDFCKIFGVSADYIIGTDAIVTVDDKVQRKVVMTSGEVEFIENLRKNQSIYSTLVDNPKKGVDLIASKME